MAALYRRRLAAYLYGSDRTNSVASFHTSIAPVIKETGLYGFHHLKTPKGFQRFVDDAIER